MYLLDTSVVSEYLKKKPARKVIEWLDAQDEHSLYISCLTIAELRKGYYKLMSRADPTQESGKAVKIDVWIQELEKRFGDRNLELDNDVLEKWAILCGRSEAEGNKLPVIDSLLAASALTHDLTVVTLNETDFVRCSEAVKIYNPGR
ncbi:MAG: type II toxin-antitoxin system VapC family toxin [Gammaproteobacteria bacterium]|nr:type II toxin-antitoxin system VapC family toxin [Gammaproteobacteria bacterium]